MKILSVFLVFMSFQVFAKVDCKKHSIYCQIKKNKPSLSNKYAMRLSNVIYKMHRKYKIPKHIYTAILMQESGYNLKAKNCHKGLGWASKRVDEEIQYCLNHNNAQFDADFCLNNIETHEEMEVCTDFGISQIYYKTARKYGFKIHKLNKDLAYSVEAGAKVLQGFMKRYKKRDKDWWVRYNCGSRGTTKRDTCQIYKKLVERYME